MPRNIRRLCLIFPANTQSQHAKHRNDHSDYMATSEYGKSDAKHRTTNEVSVHSIGIHDTPVVFS